MLGDGSRKTDFFKFKKYKVDNPIQCLQKQIKVFEKVKYEILAEKYSLILKEQKTEQEINDLVCKINNQILEYENAIKNLQL